MMRLAKARLGRDVAVLDDSIDRWVAAERSAPAVAGRSRGGGGLPRVARRRARGVARAQPRRFRFAAAVGGSGRRPEGMRTYVRALRRAPRPHGLLLPGRGVLARGAGGGGRRGRALGDGGRGSQRRLGLDGVRAWRPSRWGCGRSTGSRWICTRRPATCTLLVENDVGWRNLCRIVTRAHRARPASEASRRRRCRSRRWRSTPRGSCA